VPTYQLTGRSIEERSSQYREMIGREDELVALQQFSKPIFENQFAGIGYLHGEAGIGKSRMTFELKKQFLAQNCEWITCQADQILKKPFNPFVYALRTYFEQTPDKTPEEDRASFEENFQFLLKECLESEHPKADEIARELIRTRSILTALLGLSEQESLWEQLDAKGRYENTFDAIQTLFLAEAMLRPLVIELEDGHWFDESSKELLQDFLKFALEFPIFILVTTRYNDDGGKLELFQPGAVAAMNIAVLDIDLNILQPKALEKMAEARLGGAIDKEFSEFLQRTTTGNPFYAEQILEYFSESNLLIKSENHWHLKDQSLRLSNDITAVLTARIDRLSLLVKETVKAAAVIGREFDIPVLSEVMKTQEEFIRRNGNSGILLKEQISTAERSQIWRAMNELRYIFKHSLLREAVYDMQLRARLRELHRLIAEAIEKLYAGNIEERFIDLAFHYEQADVTTKTIEYLQKAGDYAKRNYQNQQALEYYNKFLSAIQKTDNQEEKIRVLLKKGDIQQLIGQWSDAETAFRTALEGAQKRDDKLLLARAENALGSLLLLKGNYTSANKHFELAATLFEYLDDTVGIIRVYGNLGNLNFRQGKYDEAKSYFNQCIELNKTLEHRMTLAQIVSNLGLTHMNQANYEEGIACQKEQLALCEELNDNSGMATLNTNLGIVYFEKGDYDEALTCYEKGLALSQALGNKLLTSIAIGCIGSVYERKGDHVRALQLYEQDLQLTTQLGDKQGIGIALGLIGGLYSVTGENDKAITYLEQNLEICEALGYRKGVIKAVNTLGDVYARKEDYPRALTYYDQAIDLSRKINNQSLLCESLIEKGDVLVALGDLNGATALKEEAYPLLVRLKNKELKEKFERLEGRLV
jgi:predicted ATPase